jgi:hypothetical protein
VTACTATVRQWRVSAVRRGLVSSDPRSFTATASTRIHTSFEKTARSPLRADHRGGERLSVPNVRTLDQEHTPIRGLPIEREETSVRTRPTGSHAAASQVATMDMADLHDAAAHAGRRGMPAWALALTLLFAGGGGGGVAAGVSALGNGDVDALAQDVEVQDKRLDDHDDALETLRREQIAQHRWTASEMIKQSRALSRIAEKVGAEVDVEVEAYQSGGL